jgi:diadenylate cyclase
MNFLIPGFSDILDIILVAVIIYGIIKIFKKGNGLDIFAVLGVLIVIYFLATYFKLQMIQAVLNRIQDYWILALVIIFQPEIRSGMIRTLQNQTLFNVFFKRKKKTAYNPILDAVNAFSKSRIGALIVFEKAHSLDDYIVSGGEIIDSVISSKLLMTIFNTKTILHDGAVIIRDNRIYAAKVVLPLSKNSEFGEKYGTRHLAAIGVTEISDAYCIIVSEQTGKISFSSKGIIRIGISMEELIQIISDEEKK